jgi:hypothetical protein
MVEARIHTVGAQSTVRELWRRPRQWDAVLDGVSSGDQRWLRVATELKDGADAGQSEGLAIAVSRSIQHNASGFLRVAFLSLGVAVCQDLTIEGTPQEHASFQMNTEKALIAVDDETTRKDRDACWSNYESSCTQGRSLCACLVPLRVLRVRRYTSLHFDTFTDVELKR